MAKTKKVKDALVTEEKTKKSKQIKEVEKEVEVEEIELEAEELDTDVNDIEVSDEERKETPKKATKKSDSKETMRKKADKKESSVSSIRREMKKVVWPSAGQIVKYSFAVILFCVVLCLFFEGINLVAAFVKGMFE